jgi:quercetin dioxygenase-like cupin family protein
MRTVPVVAVAILLMLGTVAWTADHMMIDPKDLKWEDVAALPPGAKVAVIEGPLDQAGPFIIRFKFPADFKVPAHWHPNIEHVTVLSGTLYMGTGDKLDMTKGHPISAGGVSIIPPKTNHFGWTKEETIVQVHGVGPWGVTFVDPADDPRKK